ncbi:MAG: ATP-binding cassette domain-containing protein [candidate division KSB1 bacterium]|nr:ATP-binding cassette domain-containing protein [candidate division KSB1 bacterium]
MNQPALLEIENLEIHFRRRDGTGSTVVHDFTLAIASGETLALVGESGCGKNTLLRCLFGLLRPTTGSIRFQGHELATLRGAALQNFRQQAQLVFQDAGAALNPLRRIHKCGQRTPARPRPARAQLHVTVPINCWTWWKFHRVTRRRCRRSSARASAIVWCWHVRWHSFPVPGSR